MRKLIALTAVAPLALLAACGEAPVTEEEVAAEPAGMGLDTTAATEYAAPGEISDDMDYSGDYTLTGLDGSESTMTLNRADNTYSYTAPGMSEPRTGSYTMADNRIEIADFDNGEPAYFSVSNDALYRLADQDRLYSDTEGSTIYVRGNTSASADQPGMNSVAPNASTNSVADKMN